MKQQWILTCTALMSTCLWMPIFLIYSKGPSKGRASVKCCTHIIFVWFSIVRSNRSTTDDVTRHTVRGKLRLRIRIFVAAGRRERLSIADNDRSTEPLSFTPPMWDGDLRERGAWDGFGWYKFKTDLVRQINVSNDLSTSHSV